MGLLTGTCAVYLYMVDRSDDDRQPNDQPFIDRVPALEHNLVNECAIPPAIMHLLLRRVRALLGAAKHIDDGLQNELIGMFHHEVAGGGRLGRNRDRDPGKSRNRTFAE